MVFGRKKKPDDPLRDEPEYYSSDSRAHYRGDREDAARQEENKRLEREVCHFSEGVEAPPSEMSKRAEVEGQSKKLYEKMNYHSEKMNYDSENFICYNCKSNIREHVNFCPYCGHPLKSMPSSPNDIKSNNIIPDQNKNINKEEQIPSELILNSTSTGQQKLTLKQKLETYRDKLLRLEQRNRSILLRRIYDKWSFDLVRLIIRGNHAVETVIEKALQKKNSVCLISDNDESDLAAKD